MPYPDPHNPVIEGRGDAIFVFHGRPDADTQLEPDVAERVINVLWDDYRPNIRLDAAWAAIDLSQHPDTGPAKGLELLNMAEQKLIEVSASNQQTKLRLRALAAHAFIPVFKGGLGAEDAHTTIGWTALADRLHEVNSAVLDIFGHDGDTMPLTATSEIAIYQLFARHGRQLGDGAIDAPLVWPASSWQERRWGPSGEELPSASFGMRFGRFSKDTAPGRAQVITFLHPRITARLTASESHEAHVAHWQSQYDAKTRLVFGDKDLANSPRNSLNINQILASPETTQKQIGRVTRKVMSRLGLDSPG